MCKPHGSLHWVESPNSIGKSLFSPPLAWEYTGVSEPVEVVGVGQMGVPLSSEADLK